MLLTSIVIINIKNDTKSGSTNYARNDVKIYTENAIEAINKDNKDEDLYIQNQTNVKQNFSENVNTINFTLLGEIMMGGNVSKNVKYIYSSAFKNIYLYTKEADFTYASFATNITNVETLENTKNKYLVTKEIINGLSALGIDSLSIATDHMVDYSEKIFNNTKSILEKNDILVAGQKDTPVYFEKGKQKVAIVSTNSVILKTKNLYNNLNISIYNKENFKKNIEEAKKIADVVIADIHWGKEYEYGVTSQMTQIAKIAIDSGADLVIGSHAAGVYPVITYKNKPIIYSAGYLISDSDLYVAQESFIFELVIEDKKIKSIIMTPILTYEKKEVKLYQDYSIEKCNQILEMYNKWHNENGLDSNIKDNKIVINFN